MFETLKKRFEFRVVKYNNQYFVTRQEKVVAKRSTLAAIDKVFDKRVSDAVRSSRPAIH